MPYPLYIAWRYLKAKSSQNAVNLINAITFLVVVIGAMALFIVLSAFSGLKEFSLQFTNEFDPDLKAIPATGKFFELSDAQIEELNQLEGVEVFSKEIEERVYLSYDDKSLTAYVKGVDENYNSVVNLNNALEIGNWGLGENTVVMGAGIYYLLGGPLNNFHNPVQAITLKPGKGSVNANALAGKSFYNQIPLVVTGVFSVEEAIDKKYVLLPIKVAQEFINKDPNQISGINFKLKENVDLENLRKQISISLGDEALVLSRKELNGTLHKMLNTENLATYLIFTLVLIIALFNVIGAIMIMILDKKPHSKTLFAMGSPISKIRLIYFLQGLLICLVGGLVGLALGALLVGSQLWIGWWMITPDLEYPVAFDFGNLILVLATITVLGAISSTIASSRINRKLLMS